MTATATDHPTPDQAPHLRFRGDVDGLRAIAIALVVAFHVGLEGFSGGFVGVDAFFVISGYLITRNLLAESETAGRPRLLSFWAKRIRRLVPAMTLMVLATLGASLLVLSRVVWEQIAKQGIAAALYVSNLLFAGDAQDYFARDLDESPFLHTWSLGVEEQFYLVWPLLFVVATLLARRRPQALRSTLLVLFGLTLVGSFLWNLDLAARGSAWAFFGLPARAWEFAVAGILAAVTLPRALLRTTAKWVMGIGGLALLAVATLGLSETTPYPGWAGLLPVAGTLLLIAAGDPRGEPTAISRTLGTAPMQWVGRVSYTWYLWHWPFIVLAAVAVESESTGVKLIAALVSLPVAALTHRFYENPVRFNRSLVRSRPRTYAMGAGATVAAVVAGLLMIQAVTWTETGGIQDQLIAAAGNPGDDPCQVGQEISDEPGEYCVTGDVDGDRSVLLIGDSIARQWVTALGTVAEEMGIQLDVRWRASCPALYRPRDVEGNERQRACVDHQTDTRELIEELQPDAVVIAQSAAYGRTEDEVEAAYRSFTDDMSELGTGVGFIIGNPLLPEEALDCLERGRDADSCAPATDVALQRTATERRVALGLDGQLDAALYDPTDAICDEQVCHLVIDGVLVYADRPHLTVEYTLDQVLELHELIDAIVD